MTAAVTIVAMVGMTAVALLGAVYPYRRRAIPVLEPPADPLEDRRLVLLYTLKDLESARESGAVEGDDYARLREETEGRMARVLRALDERRRAEDQAPERVRLRRSPARYVAIALVAATALAVGLVPSLLRSLHDRGGVEGVLDQGSSVAYFERQVRLHPHDVAAILNLAQRYLDMARFDDAFRQYSAALKLQPDNVDALANYGLLLHLSGRPLQGLASENRALQVDPGYPPALFYKGAILLKGLDRPRSAIGYLRSYLDAAPFGSYGPTARSMIGQAREEIAAGGPPATPTPEPSATPEPGGSPAAGVARDFEAFDSEDSTIQLADGATLPAGSCDPWLASWQKILTDGPPQGNELRHEVAYQSKLPDIVAHRHLVFDQIAMAPIGPLGYPGRPDPDDPKKLMEQPGTFPAMPYLFQLGDLQRGQQVRVTAALHFRHLPPYFIRSLSEFYPPGVTADGLLAGLRVVDMASGDAAAAI